MSEICLCVLHRLNEKEALFKSVLPKLFRLKAGTCDPAEENPKWPSYLYEPDEAGDIQACCGVLADFLRQKGWDDLLTLLRDQAETDGYGGSRQAFT